MRILLAAKHSPDGALKIGGVQSWCATIGAELYARGHDVRYWEPGDLLTGLFDLGIFANVNDTYPVMQFCDTAVSVCHGIIPAEKPVLGNTVFTSEEVRDHWQGDGLVIRQPIDLDFWSPSILEKKYLVRFSYRRGLDFVPKIAQRMGLEFVHLNGSTPKEVRKILARAVCVLATGRAALEAMACGVPVVICDHRSAYQPALLDLNVCGARLRNYSGRGGVTPTLLNVELAINEAIRRGSMRWHVKSHHDVRVITDQLLNAACLR